MLTEVKDVKDVFYYICCFKEQSWSNSICFIYEFNWENYSKSMTKWGRKLLKFQNRYCVSMGIHMYLLYNVFHGKFLRFCLILISFETDSLKSS